jgi:hypothetical protein
MTLAERPLHLTAFEVWLRKRKRRPEVPCSVGRCPACSRQRRRRPKLSPRHRTLLAVSQFLPWKHPLLRVSKPTEPEEVALTAKAWWRRWTALGCPPDGVLTASRVPRRWRWRLAAPSDPARGVWIELQPDGLRQGQAVEILPPFQPGAPAQFVCPLCGGLDAQLVCRHPVTRGRWSCWICIHATRREPPGAAP